MVLTLPDILSADDLADLRPWLANAPWADGRDSAGPQARGAKRNQQLPHDCEAAQGIRSRVLAGLNRSALFFSAALPLRLFTPRVNRYHGQTNAYGAHIDNAIRLMPDAHGATQAVRTDVSCTVFLNNPNDYDGGELRLHSSQGDRHIKLPAGHAVLYPAHTVHEVTPVTRGERLACFLWVQSLVRSDEQRRLLFDMDMALLDLRHTQGDTPPAVALTGTYHNLLRLWADT